MKIKSYLRDRIPTFLLLLCAVLSVEIFLMAYKVGLFVKIYIPVAVFTAFLIGIFIEYFKKRSFYNNVIKTIDELDDKYLITEIIEAPDFTEGKIFIDVLSEANKSMHSNVNKYKYITEDYKEYIELWIHETKIPLATSKLIIENNKNAVTKSIDEELSKLENYIEQALFYARSNGVEKDYCITRCSLHSIINSSVKKNKSLLISQNVLLNIHDVDYQVNTDSKWIVFILNQIIQNSLKYRDERRQTEIHIYGEKGKENVSLYIADNGIGVSRDELSRVFEKGFTGHNGRNANKKSTGIGLYLCKKLCEKLGIKIDAIDTNGEGFTIKLTFPNGSFTVF